MILELEIQNFQKHENLSLTFSSGLQVIRGDNEAGKSTIFRAIAYAWWGSRALPESLDETVTDGKPPTSLKVRLKFMHGGVTYEIVRKKSGATLIADDGTTASGQAEVTAFMERLFRATADVARSTLLTSQKALEDGLDSSAMSLIEKLSNMQLIDQYITRIQHQLPSGNTKVLESQIQTTELPEPVLNLEKPEQDLKSAEARLLELTPAVAELKAELTGFVQQAESAKAKNQHNALVAEQAVKLESELANCQLQPEVVPTETLEDLECAAAEQAQAKATAKNRANFVKYATQSYSTPIQKPLEAVKRLYETVTSEVKQLEDFIRKSDSEKAVLIFAKITETVCGLCDKDLSQVPEVVAKNAQNAEKLSKLELTIAEAKSQLIVVKAKMVSIHEAVMEDKNLERALPIEGVEVDLNQTPRKLTWVGPPEPEVVDSVDWTQKIAALKSKLAILNAARLQNAGVNSRKAQLQEQLDELAYQKVSDEEEYAIAALPQLKKLHECKQLELNDAIEFARKVEQEIGRRKAVHGANVAAWEASKVKRAELLKLLAETQAHNTLIAKLRDARPVVASELWSLVLSGVSHYFSTIRGTPSVVTRSTEGFMIDGKGIKRYSGSTKDSLGVANRLMLQKTFLPDVSLMLIDEPGAAFDRVREGALLGVLSSIGIEQVIVVTHSDIADSFAANVIRI